MLAVLLFVLAVVLSFQWGNIVSERGEVGREAAENDLSKARSTQRSKKNLEKGSKEMSSQEAFDRLKVIGELALSEVVDKNISSEDLLDLLEEIEGKHKEIKELLSLIDYDQAFQLFEGLQVKVGGLEELDLVDSTDYDQVFQFYENFHVTAEGTEQWGVLVDVTKAVIYGSFSRMVELDIDETLVVFEQEQDDHIRHSLMGLLITGWSKFQPHDALIWWRNYASENSHLVTRVSEGSLFDFSLDQDLYKALSEKDFHAALEEAKSEEDDLVRMHALIGLVKGLPAEGSIDEIAEQVLELAPEKEKLGEVVGEDGNLYLEQMVALKWLERDVNGALNWYQSQQEGQLVSDDYFKEQDIQGELFGSDKKLVERWASADPDGFLSWVEGRGNTDQYQTVVNFYYNGVLGMGLRNAEKAMEFIARQKDGELRRDLFRNAVRESLTILIAIEDNFIGLPNMRSKNAPSPKIEFYDQSLENVKRSNLPTADKEELTAWLLDERQKIISGE